MSLEGTVVEILCRLPSKSLMRFKCVCKSWFSLISEPWFIDLHRRHSPSILLLQLFNERRAGSNPLICSLRRDDENHSYLSVRSSLRLPVPVREEVLFWSKISGSCHGLLCLSNCAGTFIYICNPSIQRFCILPELPEELDNYLYDNFGRSCSTLAFGFDSQNRDYKVVIIILKMKRDGYVPRVFVFSLASRSWKELPSSAILTPIFYLIPSANISIARYAIVNGIAHWVVKRWASVESQCHFFLLSFDFENEVFREVALPESLTRQAESGTFYIVGEGDGKTLTVYHVSSGSPHSSGSIWVMKEYGIVGSWTKVFQFHTDDDCLQAPPNPLCVTSNGEIMLLMMLRGEKTRRLYLLDMERGRFVDLHVEEEARSRWYEYAGYYSDSLGLLQNTHIDFDAWHSY